MKVFIDGFGVAAQAITRKLTENHGFKKCDIFVNTYDLPDNHCYLEYLKAENIKNVCLGYRDATLIAGISEFKPDYVISIYGRRIIPSSVLELANLGTFNFHPSLLPDYKGCFSSVWAIINNEKYTGITIHEMAASIDTGDILYQERVQIADMETAYSLYHKLVERFVGNFDVFFSQLLEGGISARPMPKTGRYFPRQLPFDGLIDPRWDDLKIESFIMAMNFPPFPGAMLKIDDKFVEFNSMVEYKNYQNRG